MSDNDLIRRGNAVLAVTAADKDCLGANGAREFIRALPAVTLPDDVAKVVEEAGKVLEGVTPGPWAYNSHREVGPLHTEDDQAFGMICDAVCEVNFDADHLGNARFIAWCREGVPALTAVITAQAAKIAEVEQ